MGSALASSAEVLAVGSPEEITLLDEDGDSTAIDFSGEKTLMVFSPDGSQLATSSLAGNITIFTYRDGQLAPLSSFWKGQVVSLAFHPDGTLLTIGTTRNVYLMDTATADELARIPHLSTVNGVSFSADGKHLATGSSQGLQFWEMASIQLVKSDDLIETACSYLYENFGLTQWDALFEYETYQSVCEDLPVPE